MIEKENFSGDWLYIITPGSTKGFGGKRFLKGKL
jgi:hypothetical protein